MVYHCTVPDTDASSQACGTVLLPLKTSTKGPAPSCEPGAMQDQGGRRQGAREPSHRAVPYPRGPYVLIERGAGGAGVERRGRTVSGVPEAVPGGGLQADPGQVLRCGWQHAGQVLDGLCQAKVPQQDHVRSMMLTMLANKAGC
eukprot:jgi/Mesvir1/15446/Mv26331-RA.1